jgi:carbonic anhydrase
MTLHRCTLLHHPLFLNPLRIFDMRACFLRRLLMAGLLLLMAPGAWALAPVASPPPVVSVNEALEMMLAGNQRFVQNRATHPHQGAAMLKQLADAQHPFAAILGCSDSRTAPEVIFDQGLGDLFDVRVAGNIADNAVMGSLEYAVTHLHMPVIVVLGHQHCGAIAAALAHQHPHNHISYITRSLQPSVRHVHHAAEAATRKNVQLVRQRLEHIPVLRDKIRRGELKIVGAYYHLDSGEVEILSNSRVD